MTEKSCINEEEESLVGLVLASKVKLVRKMNQAII